jgi:nitrous oxidase accessory protein NosD
MSRSRFTRFRPIQAVVAALAVVALIPLTAAPAAAATAPAGVVQESSPDISYSGSWKTLNSSGSYGGAIQYASVSTASASLTFTGSSITWYTWNSANAGIVNVYIDGEFVAAVDNYAPSTKTGVIGFRQTLEPGTHTIMLRGSGNKNAESGGRMTHLDAFVVGGERPVVKNAVPTAARAEGCPAATVTVSNSQQLVGALRDAGPGSVIRLAPGAYTGNFELTASGTADSPVWLCGGRDAVLRTRSITDGTALRVNNAEHVRISGFSVTQALQGVMVKRSNNIVISDLHIKDVGYEAVHLYAFTTDSAVLNNTIERTGSVDVAYGEGVYIGTSQRRWGEVTNGLPDQSDDNVVIGNRIVSAGAEAIEAKEGTSRGTIAYNTIVGHQPGSRAIAWILSTGNNWTVAENTGSGAVENGYASMAWSDWGYGNQFSDNTGDADASGYGVWVHDKNRNVVVSCDNVVRSTGSGFTNVFCSP